MVPAANAQLTLDGLRPARGTAAARPLPEDPGGGGEDGPPATVVRVLPRDSGIDKCFDYTLRPGGRTTVRIGSCVRVPLGPRTVSGWVVAVDPPDPAPGPLLAVTAVADLGVAPAVVPLCRWAAGHWAGRWASVLTSASPDRVRRRGRPSPEGASPPRRSPSPGGDADREELCARALDLPVSTLVLPPGEEPGSWLLTLAGRSPVLLVAPRMSQVRGFARVLRSAGADVAVVPDDWEGAEAGTHALGARSAVFSPPDRPGVIVVWDEHDEALQAEASPTWHAREVAIERARRSGIPCVLCSPVPSLEARAAGPLHRLPRSRERNGWPVIEVVDRRRGDPAREGLYSEPLVARLREGGRVVVVVNRRGRAGLLACTACRSLAACAVCGSGVHQPDRELECRSCGSRRPPVCARCGGTRLAILRQGVNRIAEEIEALTGERPDVVSGDTAPTGRRIVVGTEAALYRVRGTVDTVAFPEFDQELLAPRYRAWEQAAALLARAGVLTGRRSAGGRVMVQTLQPDHPVLDALRRADPGRFSTRESERRSLLGFPPAGGLAVVGGAAGEVFVERLRSLLPPEGRVEERAGTWLVRAPDRAALVRALAEVGRPSGRLRLRVDPMRI